MSEHVFVKIVRRFEWCCLSSECSKFSSGRRSEGAACLDSVKNWEDSVLSFICFFLAAPSLHCFCAGFLLLGQMEAFLVVVLGAHCGGFSCWEAWALGMQASVVVALVLICPETCGISPPRDWTRVSCIGRQIPVHRTRVLFFLRNILLGYSFIPGAQAFRHPSWNLRCLLGASSLVSLSPTVLFFSPTNLPKSLFSISTSCMPLSLVSWLLIVCSLGILKGNVLWNVSLALCTCLFFGALAYPVLLDKVNLNSNSWAYTTEPKYLNHRFLHGLLAPKCTQ